MWTLGEVKQCKTGNLVRERKKVRNKTVEAQKNYGFRRKKKEEHSKYLGEVSVNAKYLCELGLKN